MVVWWESAKPRFFCRLMLHADFSLLRDVFAETYGRTGMCKYSAQGIEI
jgi:hypothetical protein